jgi:hypothetical protein
MQNLGSFTKFQYCQLWRERYEMKHKLKHISGTIVLITSINKEDDEGNVLTYAVLLGEIMTGLKQHNKH